MNTARSAQRKRTRCGMLLQNAELMPQYQDFGFQSPSRLEAIAQHADEKQADRNHAAMMF